MLCAAALASMVGRFDADTPWPLWTHGKEPPGERPGTFGPENASFPFPDDEHLTNVTRPTLTPFLLPPLTIAEAQRARSVVVVAPGGGYSILAWNKEGTDIAKWLNGLGIHALVLKYRVPGRPWLPFGGAPLMDAQRAMGLVRDAAIRMPQLGWNASSIGFIGFSAGGHLSAHLATTCSTSTSRAYPPFDEADARSCRPDFSLLVYPWRLTEDVSHLNVTARHPPAFIAQAEDDPAAPILRNALPYYARLKEVNAPPSELHIYPRGGHGYGRCTVGASKVMSEEVCSWDERAARFINTVRES